MELANVLALITVIIIVSGHIALVSQWTGKISESMKNILSSLENINAGLASESERRQSLSESVARIDARLNGLVIDTGRLEERVVSLERRQWKNGNTSSFQK